MSKSLLEIFPVFPLESKEWVVGQILEKKKKQFGEHFDNTCFYLNTLCQNGTKFSEKDYQPQLMDMQIY